MALPCHTCLLAGYHAMSELGYSSQALSPVIPPSHSATHSRPSGFSLPTHSPVLLQSNKGPVMQRVGAAWRPVGDMPLALQAYRKGVQPYVDYNTTHTRADHAVFNCSPRRYAVMGPSPFTCYPQLLVVYIPSSILAQGRA